MIALGALVLATGHGLLLLSVVDIGTGGWIGLLAPGPACSDTCAGYRALTAVASRRQGRALPCLPDVSVLSAEIATVPSVQEGNDIQPAADGDQALAA